MLTIDEIRERWGRPTNVMNLTNTPTKSLAGAIEVCNPGEKWPDSDQFAYTPVLQVCVSELPSPPSVLDDLAYICVFFPLWKAELPAEYPDDAIALEHPLELVIRTIKKGDPVADIGPQPSNIPNLGAKSYVRWTAEPDLPGYECVDMPSSDWPKDPMQLGVEKVKVGGWPVPYQGMPRWENVSTGERGEADYAIMIATSQELGIYYGDDGASFIGRGRGDLKDQWYADWACY